MTSSSMFCDISANYISLTFGAHRYMRCRLDVLIVYSSLLANCPRGHMQNRPASSTSALCPAPRSHPVDRATDTVTTPLSLSPSALPEVSCAQCVGTHSCWGSKPIAVNFDFTTAVLSIPRDPHNLSANKRKTPSRVQLLSGYFTAACHWPRCATTFVRTWDIEGHLASVLPNFAFPASPTHWFL